MATVSSCASGAHELDDPARDRLVHEDLSHRRAHRRDVLDVDGRLQPQQRMAAELLVDDPVLVLRVRIAERRAEEEAVELRLGQRERALVLDRVLGRHARGTARAAGA